MNTKNGKGSNVGKKIGVIAAVSMIGVSPLMEQGISTITGTQSSQSNTAHAASLGMAGANIQTGVLTQDMTDSTGYVYKAGTQVARFVRDDDVSKLTGNFNLVLSVQHIMAFGYGHVPEQYVKATGNKVYKDVGEDGIVASNSFVTEAGKTETLKPVGSAVVDKSALKTAISNGQAKLNGSYTAASKAALQTAITNGQGVVNNTSATQTQVDTATANINNAINALVPMAQVNKSALLDAIVRGNTAINGEFTESSKAALRTAITNGQAVNNNADATQAQVDAATAAINKAIDGLVANPSETQVDKTDLEAAIKTGSDKMSGDFTAASKATLQSALNAGKVVDGNKDATQAQVDTATENIIKAIDDLVANPSETQVDKSALEKEVKVATGKASGDFTNESLKVLNTAIENAKKVLSDKNATQSQVDDALTTLQAAENQLVANNVGNDNSGNTEIPSVPGNSNNLNASVNKTGKGHNTVNQSVASLLPKTSAEKITLGGIVSAVFASLAGLVIWKKRN